MDIPTQEIWQQFSTRLKQFILRRVQNEHDAEDILQEVFLKIHRGIDQLQARHNIQAWIYQVTRNTIFDHYRRRSSKPGFLRLPENLAQEPLEPNIRAELAVCLQPMLDALPEKYRQAIELTHFQGMTQKELAEKLGLSLPGAKSRIQRGREKLKQWLTQCCNFEFDRRGRILSYQPRQENCIPSNLNSRACK